MIFCMRIPMIATRHSDRSRPPVPIDRDQCGAAAGAPLGEAGNVNLPRVDGVGQARREAVRVVNRRDPRATRRALTADAAARAGGAC